MSGLYLGCQQVPKLTDYRVTNGMTGYQAWVDSIPIVIVGTISVDVPVDRPVSSYWNPEVLLELHRLTVHVGNTLRGNLQAGTILVYYFKIASSYEGNPPLGSWLRGERNVFYIRRDAGVLRLACDLKNHCTFPIETGAHPDFRADPSQPLDAAFSELLLTKGIGVGDSDFAQAVDRNAQFIAKQYAVPKLRLLAANSDRDIHDTVCYALKTSFSLPCETQTPQSKK